MNVSQPSSAETSLNDIQNEYLTIVQAKQETFSSMSFHTNQNIRRLFDDNCHMIYLIRSSKKFLNCPEQKFLQKKKYVSTVFSYWINKVHRRFLGFKMPEEQNRSKMCPMNPPSNFKTHQLQQCKNLTIARFILANPKYVPFLLKHTAYNGNLISRHKYLAVETQHRGRECTKIITQE